jgi:hypothetical protein
VKPEKTACAMIYKLWSSAIELKLLVVLSDVYKWSINSIHQFKTPSRVTPNRDNVIPELCKKLYGEFRRAFGTFNSIPVRSLKYKE